MLHSSLRETAEIAGAAFAIDKVKEFAVSMAEMGEKALNTSFALNITIKQLAELQGVFTLAGGNADDAQRTFERLGVSVQDALTNRNGQAAHSFQNLGISLDQVKAHANDFVGLLKLLIIAISTAIERNQALADAHRVAGRGLDTLIPVIRQGISGYDELAAKSEDYKRAMAAATPVEDQEAKLLNELTLQTHILAHDGFMALAPIILSVTNLLRGLTKELDETIQSTETDIQNIMRLGDAFQNFLSKMTGGLIPKAEPETTLPDVDVTADRNEGTAGPGGHAKGQASEVQVWREQLQQKLEAERNFFKDLTAEELAFWQSKIGLTRAGSKEQAEVANTIYGLEKRMALQGLADARAAESQQETLDREYLARFEANMKLMVASKQVTLKQALGFDIQYTKQIEEEEAKRLQALIADDRLSLSEKAAYQEKLIELETTTGTKIVEMQTQAADQTNRAWTDALKQVSDQMATFATDVIDRTELISKAFDQMIRKIIDDILKANIQNLFESAFGLGGGGAGGGGTGGGAGGAGLGILGTLGGGLLKDAFGAAIGNPFSGSSGGLLGGSIANSGIGAMFSGLFGGGAGAGVGIDAADVASMWGGGGADAVAAGMAGTAGAGGITSMLPMLASAAASAAGGWVVPAFDNGGILSVLHQNEMVLPSYLSTFVQNAAANASGGGGPPMNITVQALDGASAHKVLMANAPSIMAAFNRAARNGVRPRISD